MDEQNIDAPEPSAAQTVLEEIIASKIEEVEQRKSIVTMDELRYAADRVSSPRDFLGALVQKPTISLIAEVKKASPSAGLIREDFDPAAIAAAYQAGGASCLSVLTDEQFFEGRLQYLTLVKSAVEIPVLRKDFIIDPYQLFEARAAGADAVLLIAEALDDRQLADLHEQTVALAMTPLVEFHQAENLQRVIDLGAKLIGINNRDLRTFHTDVNQTLELRKHLPDACTVVSESGIQDHADLVRLFEAKVDAVLVGEHLMRQPDIQGATQTLLNNQIAPD